MSEIFEVSEEWVLSEEWVRHSMSDDLLRHCLTHGDRVLLANLINITRLTFRSHIPNWFHALPSKFDV